MGRPPLSKEERLTYRVTVAFREDQGKALEALAALQRRDVAELIRIATEDAHPEVRDPKAHRLRGRA